MDNGVTIITMDKKDYTDKALSLLGDSNTYRTIPKDPTNKLKNKLIGILKESNRQVDSRTHLTPKCTQQVQSLPITYGVAKELEGIICPLVGQSPLHLKKTQHFVQQIYQVKLEQGKVITSYDVKALFTSVPVDPSINIVQQRFSQDPTLLQRNQMTIQQIAT